MLLRLLGGRLSSSCGCDCSCSVLRRHGGVQGPGRPGWNLHPRTDQLARYGGCGCVVLRLSCSLLLLEGCTGLESLDLELVLLLLLLTE